VKCRGHSGAVNLLVEARELSHLLRGQYDIERRSGPCTGCGRRMGANMQEDLVQKIVSNPEYQHLVRVRTRYGWTLTALMMIVYYGYILLIAFDKELLSARIGNGVLTWGIPAGLFVIVFTVAITGIYVWRANQQFDQLTEAIRQEVL
jgi:uncharacterized membrane protein (DUF485 family)